MTKPIKILLGALTLTPIAASVYVMSQFFSQFSKVATSGGSVAPADLSLFLQQTMAVQGITMATTLGLLVFYLWHVMARRPTDNPTMKLVWVLLLLFGTVLTMPIYWLLYIWPSAVPSSAGTTATAPA